ncbi:MAG: Helicase associated domain protein [Pedobacter sp.]
MNSKHPATTRYLYNGLFDGLSSFAEIEARISALPSNKEIGDAFEVFAEAYLATQKIVQAREVWPFETIPLEQRKSIGLDTGTDKGVDGTYRTINDELRAYQVKFRSRRPSLTWDELSTFMGLTDQVSQRVLFTNCEALPTLMRDRSGFVAIRGSDLDRLTANDLEAMRQWLQGSQVKLPRKEPHPHQLDALDAINTGLNGNDRATVVMACGTGKTLVALWAAERRNCRNLLVLVPSLALVRQMLHEWLRETATENLTFLCVCSDPTVAKGADDLIVHQADLDFPVTTESASVRKFLTSPFEGVKVVFSTYQSAHVVAEGMDQAFDLGIFDEAHKTAGRTGTHFNFALDDNNLPIHKRIFFTATPRHYDIRKKDKENESTLVYSMDRPDVYGPVVYTLSFAEAARRGIICDYKVVISVVTSDMVNDHLLNHGEVIVDGDPVKAHQVALQIALQKAVEKYHVSRIFTFHGTVAAAHSFTSNDGEGIHNHLPDFATLHVSGAMPTALRENHMKAFRQATKAVMSNARCLTEGVDVPAVDMVAFMSPRKSKVDIVQATGRAMRKSSGKEFGYVMVPLFLEQAANESVEEALQRTGFDDLWDILAAMKEQDDVLADIIRRMREDKGMAGEYDVNRFNERIEVLGPSLSLESIRQSITAECLEYLGVTWDERFGELLAYKVEHGDANVPIKWHTGLGQWASAQRQSKKTGNLSITRFQRLDKVGFCWESFESQWDKSFSELIAYKTEHENLKVPHSTNGLGGWISQQRKGRKKGQISEDRIRRLDEIGFDWDPMDSQWEASFSELVAYKTEHGDIKVPQSATSLVLWIKNQRQSRKKGDLSEDRIRRIDEIGFDWDHFESQWERTFSKLLAYKMEHGDTNAPQSTTLLGDWVVLQRQNRKIGQLSEDKIRRLDEICFDWDPLGTQWEERFSELVSYKTEYSDTNVPQKWPSGLGRWIDTQRQNRKKGRLSEEKIKRLDEIGFEWGKSV